MFQAHPLNTAIYMRWKLSLKDLKNTIEFLLSWRYTRIRTRNSFGKMVSKIGQPIDNGFIYDRMQGIKNMEQITPATKEISPKSTKKQLWDAYKLVLQGVAKKQDGTALVKSFGDSLHTQEEVKIAEQMSALGFQKVMGDIGQLK